MVLCVKLRVVYHSCGYRSRLAADPKKQRRGADPATARDLFLERGFEAVPMAEMARVAEVSEATVFNYFPTKETFSQSTRGVRGRLLSSSRDRPSGESELAAFSRS